MIRSTALLIGLLCASIAFADGTVSTAELLNALRDSNPQLVKTLESGFDLDKDAEGVTIGRAMNPQLAGTRIGPYSVSGTIHGAADAVKLTITLNTQKTFTDARGNKTAKPAAAAKVTEKLESITITTNTP